MQQIEGMLTQAVVQPPVGCLSMAPNHASLPFAPAPSLHQPHPPSDHAWHDDETGKENTDP